ncbi:alpha/beta fold hydrolase [Marinoscillum sp. MHG1-6]|uniref:alpha/beta fold hydrolase n=1 Tax=Marinoscillum sp. MHG1-6 TaxID=2959627 RepID=UPI002156FD44|nr:alpha/beta fold hydrolase [Marinoscillum sp. MHG1-6]
MNATIIAQPWVDTDLYPFDSKYLRLEAGNMHYVDEGQGEVILFIHGTPTWSFLYRDFIKAFSSNYRCIAIDHLGFGLSEKQEDTLGTPEFHSQNLAEFIQKLDLKNITLVVHDFGGPIGLGAGIQHSDRIKKVILFNTWLWSTKELKEANKINKIVNSGLGKFLYLRLNFSPKVLLKKGFSDKKKLSGKVHQQYIHPFPDKASRQPLLQLAKALVGSSDWYQQQWEQLDQLENKEWLILWGSKDEFITTEFLLKWKNRLPQAQVTELPYGHFVQEEQTEEAIGMMQEFLER